MATKAIRLTPSRSRFSECTRSSDGSLIRMKESIPEDHPRADWKGYKCWSFAQLASTATKRYRLLRLKRGFAATSAHSARHVSIPFFKTFVQIVAAVSSLVQLGHRKTGKVTTILARTRQARSADRDRLISRNTRDSPQGSESFHRNSGKPGVNILTKTGRLRQRYGTIDQVFKTGAAA